jgi:ankyrin repeat protein
MKLSILALTLSLIIISLCYSMTPNEQLLEAAVSGNLEQVQQAFDNGANINIQDRFGYTSLDWAICRENQEIAEFLIINSAYVNEIRFINGTTSLHLAIARGYSNIVKLLLKKNANINAQDNNGDTPLHNAITYGYTEIAKLLLDAGANLTIKNNWYDISATALDFAKELNNKKIVKILEEYISLKQEAQLNPTKNILRKAIQGNYPNMIKSLLKRGIIADKEDLELAKNLKHKEIFDMLVKYLGADTGQARISRSGITSTNGGITPNIARHIMSYTL